MPALLALAFGVFSVVIVTALVIYGDRTLRVLVLVAVLVATALTLWLMSAPSNYDISNDPRPVQTGSP